MAKYFTMDEMTGSTTAKRLGIDNTPSEEVAEHLNELMSVLDLIREDWGSPIIVTSGYRCEALNKAVGGSPKSSHTIGYAVDMKPMNGKRRTFLRFLERWFLENTDLSFDQIINEYPVNGVPSWVHLGLYNRNGEQRRQSIVIK